MNSLLYPPSIDWEVTPLCNHNCIHCYNYWRKQPTERWEHKDGWYFDRIAGRIIASNPVSVQITGGEPLIAWNNLVGAIEKLLDAGIHVSINTNAALVTEEIADFLARNRIDAFVSIPCARPEVFDRVVNLPGAAARAFAGMETLARSGVRVSHNMVVTRINLPYVVETAAFIKERFGAAYFSATRASFPQNADDEFREHLLNREEFNEMLREMLKIRDTLGMRVDSAWVYSMCGFEDEAVLRAFGFNRKCGCGKYSFVLDPEGNIKACGCDSRSYGSIFNRDFSEAIADMCAWQDASMLPAECVSCGSLRDCGGGCRMDGKSTCGAASALDSTANPSNCVRKSPEPENADFNDGFTVVLNRQTRFVQERMGTRLSYKTNYEFVSDALAAFLRETKICSVADLTVASGKGKPEVCFCIRKLLGKRLVTEGGAPVQHTVIRPSVFPLLVSPYVDKCASRTVCDFAGSANNGKRHI